MFGPFECVNVLCRFFSASHLEKSKKGEDARDTKPDVDVHLPEWDGKILWMGTRQPWSYFEKTAQAGTYTPEMELTHPRPLRGFYMGQGPLGSVALGFGCSEFGAAAQARSVRGVKEFLTLVRVEATKALSLRGMEFLEYVCREEDA